MPVLTSYPGVYVDELPSGQHTVPQVPTSITAFVGRVPQGPVAGPGPNDGPIMVSNFGDYERFYGGLRCDYPLGYAVQDFFNNGGSEAVIARLFEPSSVQQTGFAKLRFPVSPALVPDGWMLSKIAKAGDNQLTISEPGTPSEGEPGIGMLLTIGTREQQYTIIDYNPAKENTPATISIFPALVADTPDGICTTLTFQQGPTPAGWSVTEDTTKSPLVIQGGQGIPNIGDLFTIGADTTNLYQITSEPLVTVSSGNNPELKISISFEYGDQGKAPALGIIAGTAINISPLQPSPLPNGWQIQSHTAGKTTGTYSIINGTGAPLPNDEFTVGSSPTFYKVTAFTPADDTSSPPTPAQLTFKTVHSSDQLPGSNCFYCPLVFNRPAPVGYTMTKSPKVGETALTIQGTIGVVDLGDTFRVQGDSIIYTVRSCSRQPGGVVNLQFLPEASSNFFGEITFSRPLALEAANPGSWRNMLTAKVDTNGITKKIAKSFAEYGLEKDDLFNLTLQLLNTKEQVIQSESYLNITVKQTGLAANYPNRLDRVLESQSMLARAATLAMVPPDNGASSQGIGGDDGKNLSPATYLGNEKTKTGLFMLDRVPAINLMCIPPDRRIFEDIPECLQDLDPSVRQAAAEYCTNRRALYIVDPPAQWSTLAKNGQTSKIDPDSLGITGVSPDGIEYQRNAAVFFPRVYKEDILLNGKKTIFPACGLIAGAFAANDVARGVWKAPAGQDVGLAGVTGLEVNISDNQNGILNPLGINCLRSFPVIGHVIWGARTLRGADEFQDDYKYIPVRRLTLYIEDALYQGTQWAAFEPNDKSLWSALRQSAETFLAGLASQGAFYDYKVTCDATTTTARDISLGIVNLLVQIAPVDPAEFVIIQIQQITESASS